MADEDHKNLDTNGRQRVLETGGAENHIKTKIWHHAILESWTIHSPADKRAIPEAKLNVGGARSTQGDKWLLGEIGEQYLILTIGCARDPQSNSLDMG